MRLYPCAPSYISKNCSFGYCYHRKKRAIKRYCPLTICLSTHIPPGERYGILIFFQFSIAHTSFIQKILDCQSYSTLSLCNHRALLWLSGDWGWSHQQVMSARLYRCPACCYYPEKLLSRKLYRSLAMPTFPFDFSG